MNQIDITQLLGDGIGPELETAIDRVTEILPLNINFQKIDWSLETRQTRGAQALDEGIQSLRDTQVALKYPTITKLISPNAVLRRQCNFSVIYRPVVSIPGITTNFKENVDLHIVRVATGGTYEDPGQLIGTHAAVSLRLVEQEPCEHAATFAFELARRLGCPVTSSSKHTIQRITDGLFESIAVQVHERFPFVKHEVELFDALLAKIIIHPEHYKVVLVLNEYGDFLSDMASGLVGSMGTGASGNFAFNPDHSIALAMFDPAGGTAPDIAGKDICNPSAVLFAYCMLLEHIGHRVLGDALKQSILGAIESGQTTCDLGGELGCSDFTDVVIELLKARVS